MVADPSPRRAKKSLGQNFLVDPNIQRKIIAALDMGPEDEVLEIGPGRGALTQHLVGIPRHVVLVELDDRLSTSLDNTYGDRSDTDVIHADFLKVNVGALVEDLDQLKVVGNIPYNVTALMVFKLLERPRPAEIVLMVQREVARRMTAKPGTSEYGALSVGIQSVAAVELLFRVPAKAFRPVPRVESAVVRIVPNRPPSRSIAQERDLRVLTRAAFSWRRKQFQKILRSHGAYGLSSEAVGQLEATTGLSLTRRPETFSPDEFALLAQLLSTTEAESADL
jgi:16S rRNA (adenine1518-N6/adenine1519-N6)-dimethyltransferase